jgi:hypothetical protein
MTYSKRTHNSCLFIKFELILKRKNYIKMLVEETEKPQQLPKKNRFQIFLLTNKQIKNSFKNLVLIHM